MTQFTDVDPIDDDNDFKRDGRNRPRIVAPDGKTRSYARSSGAAKAIEDTYHLDRYDRRLVAYGMAVDASLQARVLAVGGDPGTWGKTEKDAVDLIVADARTAAKAHRAADIGTAVHKMTERVDRGEAVVGGPYAADLHAYRAELDRLGIITHPQWIECRMVCDDLMLAGTADRIVTLAPDSIVRRTLADRLMGDEALISDLKTGATVDFGTLSFAAQLAGYAGGTLYDPVTDTRLPTPLLSRQVGLIVHLPAGSGTCRVYAVDLVEGRRAAFLANGVRNVRNASKRWLTPLGT